MLDLAERGSLPVPPEEALEVARFVIEGILRQGCRFDLRLFVNKAIQDYVQWKDDETESDWRDLVTASLEEHLVAVRHAGKRPSRADRKVEAHTIIRQIEKDHPTAEARIRAWSERTGKSARAFYRRLAEMM